MLLGLEIMISSCDAFSACARLICFTLKCNNSRYHAARYKQNTAACFRVPVRYILYYGIISIGHCFNCILVFDYLLTFYDDMLYAGSLLK